MKDGASGAFVQAYNAQAAVDDEQQVIVAAEVTQDCNDKEQLVPMVERIQQNLKAAPDTLTADAGYFSDEALGQAGLQGIDLLVPPDSQAPWKEGEELAPNAPRSERADPTRAG